MPSATLVSSETVTSADQVQCLVEWTLGGGASGRKINLGGDVSEVSNLWYWPLCNDALIVPDQVHSVYPLISPRHMQPTNYCAMN